jgi:plasmid stabilization system protein ParE
MADLVFRRAALRDLERITARIAREDPGAARRLRERILDRIDVLRTFADSAQPRPELVATSEQFRSGATSHLSE